VRRTESTSALKMIRTDNKRGSNGKGIRSVQREAEALRRTLRNCRLGQRSLRSCGVERLLSIFFESSAGAGSGLSDFVLAARPLAFAADDEDFGLLGSVPHLHR